MEPIEYRGKKYIRTASGDWMATDGLLVPYYKEELDRLYRNRIINRESSFSSKNIIEIETKVFIFHESIKYTFIESYVKRSERWRYPKFIESSERIYDYKCGGVSGLNYYNPRILKKVSQLAENFSAESVFLISMPRSNEAKIRVTDTSIKYICANKSKLGKVNVVDCGHMLVRKSSVRESNKSAGNRVGYSEHKSTIEYVKTCEIPENVLILVLDDLITTGSQMSACIDILSENGLNRNNIVGLAIGETVYTT